MPKTWLISQVFYPDETSTGYVMTKIAEKLSESSTIHVICGNNEYQSKNLQTNYRLSDKIKILRVNTPRWDKNSLSKRILVFLLFTWSVFIKILVKIKKDDHVIIVTNPPTLIILAGLLKKIKSFRYSIVLHDVFPENAVAAGAISKESFIYKLTLYFFNFGYRQADSLISLGKDMSERLISKGIDSQKIHVIQNWADHHQIKPAPHVDRNDYFNLQLDNKVVFQFAGNVGRVQALEKFIKLFNKAANPDLILLIIGDGAHKKIIQKYVTDTQIENVYFFDSKPRTEQQVFLNSCDIGLITISEGMYGLGIPSKVYNIMSAGKAILYVGDEGSEIDTYIKENPIGWSFSWKQEQEIINFLSSVRLSPEILDRGTQARQFVLDNFTQDIILNKYQVALQ
jgi:glycosyltransferase involved in cell wall biosynthesis